MQKTKKMKKKKKKKIKINFIMQTIIKFYIDIYYINY